MKKIFKGNQKAWNSFPEPELNTLAPNIGIAVEAKRKSPKVGQATKKFEEYIRMKYSELNRRAWLWVGIKNFVNSFQVIFYNKMDDIKRCSELENISL